MMMKEVHKISKSLCTGHYKNYQPIKHTVPTASPPPKNNLKKSITIDNTCIFKEVRDFKIASFQTKRGSPCFTKCACI